MAGQARLIKMGLEPERGRPLSVTFKTRHLGERLTGRHRSVRTETIG